MIDRFPILVKHFDSAHPSDTAVCCDCHAEIKWDPGDGDPNLTHATHDGCDGRIVFKFDTAEACRMCGKLAHDLLADGCCSRVCALQAEHLDRLARRDGVATVPDV